MSTSEVLEYQLPSGLLGRKHTLRLTPEYVAYEAGNKKSGLFTKVEKDSIADIRQDMNWIIWYRFYVGCEFKIDIKTNDDNVLKINFTSYFNKTGTYIQLYNEITDHLLKYFLNEKVMLHVQQLQKGKVVELQEARLSKQGIALAAEETLLTWEEVRVKLYPNFFVIYKHDNPEIYKQVYYYAWESEVLLGVIEHIINDEEASIIAE
ncbi:hypothetical protein ACMA1I_01915 [Pontibacter sp. 13R65]|uniref:hypothetical protein n=1 Tax=Pontibacter sp. 13R65 TaxID=3127458 RepID=UPI00301DB549